MKVMLSVVAAAMVSTAQAVPSKPVVPSMANGLKGAAMIGHRWISSTANLTLERELEAMGVRDVWTSGETEAVVPPEMWDRVELLMGGRQWSTKHEDVQDMLEADKDARRKYPYSRGMTNDTFYLAWRTYDEIWDHIGYLRTLAPADMAIEDTVVGSTYEGREIPGIRVLGGGGSTEPRPVFMMMGCHHSGEWITAMGMVFFIEQILTKYGQDAVVTRLADAFDFDLIPIMNVDGYLFSWENDQFRTWRKSRSIHPANIAAFAECELTTPGSCEGCFGTDMNRNWDINWCGIGASENPCSGSYCGIDPFAEIEARTLAAWIVQREPVVYIDHHCCGDMYLEPWGWTEELPPDHDDIDKVWSAAKAATDLLYGRNYRQGPTFTTIYPASGLGLDYNYRPQNGETLVPFSIATEMRSSNGNGPADPVLPGSEELWEGVKAAGLVVLNEFVPTHWDPDTKPHWHKDGIAKKEQAQEVADGSHHHHDHHHHNDPGKCSCSCYPVKMCSCC